MKALVNLALKNSGNSERYQRRIQSHPLLAKHAFLPGNMSDIANDEPPWFCHGLAFKIATYPSHNRLFGRLEMLLQLPQNAVGWQHEYANWNSSNSHWAKRWDNFYHFLWLLQCHEYFFQQGPAVSFPYAKNRAKPDLLVRCEGQVDQYAECYFYSKWWSFEFFLSELLCKIDPALSIKRPYNVKMPLMSDQIFVEMLKKISNELRPEKFDRLKTAAKHSSPVKVISFDQFEIFLEGEGHYIPSDNFNGDASISWSAYLKEIFPKKENNNDLKSHRPNIVMVNSLGMDFQLSKNDSRKVVVEPINLPSSIDEIWIASCGVRQNLISTRGIKKFCSRK